MGPFIPSVTWTRITCRSSAKFLRAYHSSVIVNDWPDAPKPLAMPGNVGSTISIRAACWAPWIDELAADHLDVRVIGPLVARLPWWPNVSVAQCIPMKPLPPRIAS